MEFVGLMLCVFLVVDLFTFIIILFYSFALLCETGWLMILVCRE